MGQSSFVSDVPYVRTAIVYSSFQTTFHIYPFPSCQNIKNKNRLCLVPYAILSRTTELVLRLKGFADAEIPNHWLRIIHSAAADDVPWEYTTTLTPFDFIVDQ
jgi:hypothetical protein